MTSHSHMLIHRKNVSEEDSVVFTEQSTISLGNMKVTTVPNSNLSTGGKNSCHRDQLLETRTVWSCDYCLYVM